MASTEEKKKAETNAKTSVDSSFDSQMDEFCEPWNPIMQR